MLHSSPQGFRAWAAPSTEALSRQRSAPDGNMVPASSLQAGQSVSLRLEVSEVCAVASACLKDRLQSRRCTNYEFIDVWFCLKDVVYDSTVSASLIQPCRLGKKNSKKIRVFF